MSYRNADHVHNWFEYGVDYRRRIVRIDEDINELTASYAISGLLSMDTTPGPITVRLSTYGGEWWPGMAIYDAIRSMENHVTILGTGYVMSMGTIILQAGDERLLTPNTEVMIHVGSESVEAHYHDFQRYAKTAERYNRQMEDIYLEQIRKKNPKFSRAQIQKLIAHDTYLTAYEAIQLGLADKLKE